MMDCGVNLCGRNPRANNPAGIRLIAIAGAVVMLFLIGACQTTDNAVPAAPPELYEAREDDSALLVGSFNIRMVFPSQESRLRWLNRRDQVVAVIAESGADVIGLQEVANFTRGMPGESEQLSFLMEHLPEYSFAGIGDPARVPCENPILYSSDRLEKLDEGYLFFSSRPDELYSVSWGAGQPVFSSWTVFRDLAVTATPSHSDRLWVFNVHYDHLSGVSRRNATRIMCSRIQKMVPDGEPVVVLGDFNAFTWLPSMRMFVRDGWRHALPKTHGTFHAFTGRPLWPRIDHILINDEMESHGGHVLIRGDDGVYPSDHFPVFAVVENRG